MTTKKRDIDFFWWLYKKCRQLQFRKQRKNFKANAINYVKTGVFA